MFCWMSQNFYTFIPKCFIIFINFISPLFAASMQNKFYKSYNDIDSSPPLFEHASSHLVYMYALNRHHSVVSFILSRPVLYASLFKYDIWGLQFNEFCHLHTLWNHQHNPDIEHLHYTPNTPFASCQPTSSDPPSGDHCLYLLSLEITLHISRLSNKCNHFFLYFWSGFFHLA